ncbi:hypothetical protein G7054_g7869 [Neopestalotiopsis clavispora]|nr:hypothetical protein G7054_g7869 [Neopestalotiopsis clavispora]
MNQAGLAEQGEIPLSPISLPETSQRELSSSPPTIPSVLDEHNSAKMPVPQTETQGNMSSQASQSAVPSQQSKKIDLSQAVSPPNECYLGSDTLRGWPSIAIKQSRPYNTGNLRKFDVLNRRLMVDLQTKMWTFEKIVQEKDNEDRRDNPERLRKLSFDPADLIQTWFLPDRQCTHANSAQHSSHADTEKSGQSSGSASEQSSGQTSSGASTPYSCPQYTKNQVMEAASCTMIKYYLLMILSSHVEKLPRVSHYSYENFREFVKNESLDGDAWRALMDGEDDFVTTRKGLVHENFEWIMHGQPRFGLDRLISLQKFFMRIFRQKRESTDFDNKNKYVSPKKLEIFSKIIIGLFCMGMLAGPVGILLLVPLSDAQSFAIVLGFSSVVVIGLSGLDSFYATLVAFSTYTAVLVTSLSNLYQARSH